MQINKFSENKKLSDKFYGKFFLYIFFFRNIILTLKYINIVDICIFQYINYMPRISKYHEVYESSILKRNYIKIYSVLLIILNEEKFLFFVYFCIYDYMQISLYLRSNDVFKKIKL